MSVEFYIQCKRVPRAKVLAAVNAVNETRFWSFFCVAHDAKTGQISVTSTEAPTSLRFRHYQGKILSHRPDSSDWGCWIWSEFMYGVARLLGSTVECVRPDAVDDYSPMSYREFITASRNGANVDTVLETQLGYMTQEQRAIAEDA